jgi:hypothetical protein
VTEALRAPFWHFWHPVGKHIWRNRRPVSSLRNYTKIALFASFNPPLGVH